MKPGKLAGKLGAWVAVAMLLGPANLAWGAPIPHDTWVANFSCKVTGTYRNPTTGKFARQTVTFTGKAEIYLEQEDPHQPIAVGGFFVKITDNAQNLWVALTAEEILGSNTGLVRGSGIGNYYQGGNPVGPVAATIKGKAKVTQDTINSITLTVTMTGSDEVNKIVWKAKPTLTFFKQ